MPAQYSCPDRRRLLRGAGLLALVGAAPAFAQGAKAAASSRSIVIAQAVDFSQGQQDVSKDFLTGSRAAWQDINLRGGFRGRQVQHLTLETDGSPTSVRAAIDSIRDNQACVALSGTVGDQLASQLLSLSQQGRLDIAHAAPWLQTRQTVLSAFQQRATHDIGGFRVSFNSQRRSSHYVTQSMLTTDGRLIG